MWAQPLAGVIFFISILAEANRAPFDNAEAEQELVGGYHTEYSSMRFALFFLAEYAHMTTSSAFFALLFLGGYHLPMEWLLGPGHVFSPENVAIWGVLAKCAVYLTKVVLLVCFIMVIRWTLPRMRFDQVMMMAWQAVIPIALMAVVVTSVMVCTGRGSSRSPAKPSTRARRTRWHSKIGRFRALPARCSLIAAAKARRMGRPGTSSG
jgi:NADH-quinone oxidoreductase subunit H